MLTLCKVAITGGVSSGKSFVCRILSELGAYVVDADAIARCLLSPEKAIGQEVLRLLGSDVMSNGRFDRSKIADKVFDHPVLLSELEKLLHPAVREEILQEFRRVRAEGRYPLFVAEVPLLYEAHWENDFDVVVAVLTDAQLARSRYGLKHSKKSDADFNRRMERQLVPLKKARKADYVLTNNGSQLQLTKDVQTLFSNLCGGISQPHFLPPT